MPPQLWHPVTVHWELQSPKFNIKVHSGCEWMVAAGSMSESLVHWYMVLYVYR